MLQVAMRALTPKVLSEIDAAVAAAKRTGSLIRIYAEAEKIRRSNLADNIALEDIVEELMIHCASEFTKAGAPSIQIQESAVWDQRPPLRHLDAKALGESTRPAS